MDLKKFLPSLDDKEKIEHYWALVIEPGLVSAGIWRIQNQKAQVIYTSSPSSWEVDEELVNACDSALSSAIQDYPEEYEEPQKTVFGVSYNWVGGGEIKEEYLGKIKKVCKELSLTPVGFVVLPEALSHLIKSEEGTPLNGIILGVYKDNLEVSLFQLGKLIGTTQVARSVSLVEDSIEGLTRLATKGDTLPTRFLVYDGKEGELEEIRQTLLNFNWQEQDNLKFLHTPKIELFDSKKKIYAVSLAGASELADITLLEDVSDKKEEGVPAGEEILSEEPLNVDDGLSPEEFGFALEKDIRDESPKLKDTQNIFEEKPPLQINVEEQEEESNVKPVSQSQLAGLSKVSTKSFFLKSIWNGFVKTFSGFGGIRFMKPSVKLGNKSLLIGILLLLILLSVSGLAWWFYPKSTVTIFVSPQKLEETVEVGVDVGAGESDSSEKVIPGDILEKSVSGDKTKDTSGTKTVGEKAKGEVTIYRVGPEITLNSGTVLNGPDKLKFSLDNSVTIASGSASTPGVTKVSAKAEDIGPQYNLASGATFTVGNYSSSDMEAKNDQSFSGGTSREISAVSKDDQDTLLGELGEELKGKALDALQESLDKEKFLIKESQQVSEVDANFSGKVGDEAKTLKLTLTQKVGAVTVRKDELDKLASEVLKERIPQGFVLREEQIIFGFEKQGEEKEDENKFKVRISANLLPEVKTDIIAKRIAGRYPGLAQEYLSREVPGFVRAEIKIKPILPGKLKTLPHVAANIEVEVSAER